MVQYDLSVYSGESREKIPGMLASLQVHSVQLSKGKGWTAFVLLSVDGTYGGRIDLFRNPHRNIMEPEIEQGFQADSLKVFMCSQDQCRKACVGSGCGQNTFFYSNVRACSQKK